MLEQVVDNYTDGRYRVVADLLIAIFHEPLPKARPGVKLPTRQTQLVILIDSLFKLNDQKVGNIISDISCFDILILIAFTESLSQALQKCKSEYSYSVYDADKINKYLI